MLLTSNWIFFNTSDHANHNTKVPPDHTTPEPFAPLIINENPVTDGGILSIVNACEPDNRFTPLAFMIRSSYPVHSPVYDPIYLPVYVT